MDNLLHNYSDNFILMMKGDTQQDTAVNSPYRTGYDYLDSNISNTKSHLLGVSTRQSTIRLSQTQQDMYSHNLIREVMEGSRRRSIGHDINRIHPELALYAKPKCMDKDQFKFDSIPSRNKMYSSACHDKVKQMTEGLKQRKRGVTGVGEQKKVIKNRPSSAASRINTNNPKVSVAGLVSYNFNHVNARKSLGFNKLNHEQNMIDNLLIKTRRQYCASERGNKILAKTSGRRFDKHYKNQEAIMNGFGGQTQIFLNNLVVESEDNTLIYNERVKKLNFIKEYMKEQKVSYEDAAHIVNQIEDQDRSKKVGKVEVEKRDPNDQNLLLGRKMPCQRKALMIKNFQFME